MSRSRKPPLVEFGSQEWFRRAGETSLALGTARFQEALIDLYGCLIDHGARWIIRFSDAAPPDVMHTRGVPEPLVAHYNAACAEVDPFALHWRLYRDAGVRALSQFQETLGPIDPSTYNTTFKPAALISDELGLFLATIGQSCVGFFLEREVGDFTCDEIDRARAAFPLLKGLHNAHIGRVFDRMRYTGATAETEGLGMRPTLVLDRHGIEIFSTPSWQSAVMQDPHIQTAVQDMECDRPIILDDVIVNVERLDKYFSLAPSGRLLTLTRQPLTPDDRTAARARAQLMGVLTAREQDVFNLILAGGSTSSISRFLYLTKETVKNYKLRIYKKAGTNSERALIQRYAMREAPTSSIIPASRAEAPAPHRV